MTIRLLHWAPLWAAFVTLVTVAAIVAADLAGLEPVPQALAGAVVAAVALFSLALGSGYARVMRGWLEPEDLLRVNDRTGSRHSQP